MNITEQYIRAHLSDKAYTLCPNALPLRSYMNPKGWSDTVAGASLIFSHRKNRYTKKTFTEGLHAHNYYELLIYMQGEVEYISENTLISPAELTAVWFPPTQMHTARLLAPSEYERYVFYFSEDFFKSCEAVAPITEFMSSASPSIKIPHLKKERLLETLQRIKEISVLDKPYAPLLFNAYVTEVFDILNCVDDLPVHIEKVTDEMAAVKAFIDSEYASIRSVNEIADRFFYSREHLSRSFKKSYNVNVSDYLSQKRIMASLALLPKMNVADAAYAVGFKSQSAFISSFKKHIGHLPSEHKAIAKG